MKKCQKCGSPLDWTGRARKYCSDECRARVKYDRNRAWLKANPDKNAGYSRKWREENPEEAQAIAAFAYKKKRLQKMEREAITK